MTIDYFHIPGGAALPIGNPSVGGCCDFLECATDDLLSTPRAFRPGAFIATAAPVGSLFESTVDGHLYWKHLTGDVHLVCAGEAASGAAIWGSITGTLANQTDLVAALATKIGTGDIDTLAELNAIVTDATLIDTSDSRLSDARTPTAHTHAASEISDSTAAGRTLLTAADAVAQRTALNVEDGAAADQTAGEIATAYATQVGQVSGGEITAGTETALRTYSPADIVAIVGAHESGGGGMTYVGESRTGSDPNYVYTLSLGSIDSLETHQGATNNLYLAANHFLPTYILAELGGSGDHWARGFIKIVTAESLETTAAATSDPSVTGRIWTDNGLPRISGTTGTAVEIISQANAEAGTATDPQQWTSQRVAQAIAAQALQSADIGVSVQAYDADTAKTDIENIWTAPQRSSVGTLSIVSGEIDDDADTGPLKQKVTLNADITAATIINGDEGQGRIWYLLQDGTGGRTVTFSGIDGDAPTIDTTANALTVVEFEKVATTGWRFVQ